MSSAPPRPPRQGHPPYRAAGRPVAMPRPLAWGEVVAQIGRVNGAAGPTWPKGRRLV